MSFQKRIENFTCTHCGAHVVGTGYTNHCPRCLWSKHVDVQPGDRSALCGGMMEPIRIEGTVAEYRIIHRCTTCGYESKNRAEAGDDRDALIAIAKAA